jgi:hypothetical protein
MVIPLQLSSQTLDLAILSRNPRESATFQYLSNLGCDLDWLIPRPPPLCDYCTLANQMAIIIIPAATLVYTIAILILKWDSRLTAGSEPEPASEAEYYVSLIPRRGFKTHAPKNCPRRLSLPRFKFSPVRTGLKAPFP